MGMGWNFRITIMCWTDLETCPSSVTRIRQFSDPKATPSENEDAAKPNPPGPWPTTGSMESRNSSASYTDNGKLVLNGIDPKVNAGERIGLCGRTGSGKSSLVATLFGLLHQQDSEILIDN